MIGFEEFDVDNYAHYLLICKFIKHFKTENLITHLDKSFFGVYHC